MTALLGFLSAVWLIASQPGLWVLVALVLVALVICLIAFTDGATWRLRRPAP
jgi:hypothetical protein